MARANDTNGSVAEKKAITIQDTLSGRRITGSVDALIDAGYVEPDWLPGSPGRGKTRQTIFFDSEGSPKFRAPKPGGIDVRAEARGRHWMTITKLSRKRFEVMRGYLESEAHLSAAVINDRDISLDLMYCDREEACIELTMHRQFVETAQRVTRAAFVKARAAHEPD